MQFQTTETVGNPTKLATFEFFDKLNRDTTSTFINVFEKLGGIIKYSVSTWEFPTHVSNKTIAEIIHNTCFVCGGLMKDSTAYKNEDLYDQPDVLGRQKIYQQAGKAQLLKVRKCTSCGHSHT